MVVLTFQTKLFNFTMRLFDNSTVHNKICYIGKQKNPLSLLTKGICIVLIYSAKIIVLKNGVVNLVDS